MAQRVGRRFPFFSLSATPYGLNDIAQFFEIVVVHQLLHLMFFGVGGIYCQRDTELVDLFTGR